MQNRTNLKNNVVKNFNEKGDMITMENEDIKKVANMIMTDDCEQQSANIHNDVFKVVLIKIGFNDGHSYVGSIEAFHSDKNADYRAPGEKTITWIDAKGTFVEKVKTIYNIITEKVNLFSTKKKHYKLLFVVDASIAIKYFMALGALKNGEDYIAPLVTFKKERQEDLVEAATKMMEAIITYKSTFKLNVQFDNFNEYEEEVLSVDKEAEKQLKNGMLLHFDGKYCTTVKGVSFVSNWHKQPIDRELEIRPRNKNRNIKENVDKESEKSPLQYVVKRLRNDNGDLTSKRGAFMTELWSILLEKIPNPKLSREEAARVFDSLDE